MIHRAVWKYAFEPGAYRAEFSVPGGGAIRCVNYQNGSITIWIEAEPLNRRVQRKFVAIGTGNPVPVPHRAFVGTVFEGMYVWHVYEVAL